MDGGIKDPDVHLPRRVELGKAEWDLVVCDVCDRVGESGLVWFFANVPAAWSMLCNTWLKAWLVNTGMCMWDSNAFCSICSTCSETCFRLLMSILQLSKKITRRLLRSGQTIRTTQHRGGRR